MSRYRHLALFVLLAGLWGLSFPAIKAGLAYIPPVLFAAARYDSGGLLLLAYLAVASDDWLPGTRDDWLAVLAAGTFLVAGNSFVFIGEQYTTSGVAAIIYSLVPIFTSAFAWLLLPEREHRSGLSLLGIVLGLVGVWVVTNPSPSSLVGTGPGSVGKGLVLLAAVCVSLGSVLVDRLSPSLSIGPLTAWAMLVGGVILHAFSVGVGESVAAVEVTAEATVAVLYLGVFASAVAYLVYFDLLDRFGPLEVNTISYAIPVVAAVTGWLYLDETVTTLTAVGFLVIVAGFVLLKHREFAEELRTLRASA